MRSRLTLSLAAAILAILVHPAFAADPPSPIADYTVASWGDVTNLDASAVRSIVQDDAGYLWLGTDAGLVRFDGMRFDLWHLVDPRLRKTGVAALCASADGSLWIGVTSEGGVTRLHDGDLIEYDSRHGLDDYPVVALAEGHAGTIWAATRRGLYAFRDGRWARARLAGHGGDDGVRAVHVAPDGRVLVSADAGVFERDGNALGFRRVQHPEQPIESLSVDPNGGIWRTDRTTVVHRVGGGAEMRTAVRGYGTALLHDRRGHLWVGTAGEGLWRLHAGDGGIWRAEKSTVLSGLSGNWVFTLMEDGEGNVWVGTTGGLTRFSPRIVETMADLGPVQAVDATADGSVWLQTFDGVVRFAPGRRDRATMERARFQLPGGTLRSLHADQRGRVWTATNRQLFRFERGRFVPVPIDGFTSSFTNIELITSDARGNVWIQDTTAGIFRWNGRALERVQLPDAFKQKTLLSAVGDSGGRMWLGFATDRIGVVHPDGRFESYGVEDGYLAGACYAIYEDQNGVWFGGSEGLSRFAHGRFTSLARGRGFPWNWVVSIVSDLLDHLWLGTSAGLVRLELAEFEKAAASPAYEMRHVFYDRPDGLIGLPQSSPYARPNAARAADGRVWLIVTGGVTIIDPATLPTTSPDRTAMVDRLIADGTVFHRLSDVTLPPGTRRVEIHYSVPNHDSTSRTRFRYRLDGFDTRWVDAGTGQHAVYLDLPPRAYGFRVAANTNQGTWVEAESSVDFALAPMFYQTAWFYVACAIAAALACWTAWFLRLRRLRHEFAAVLGERLRLSREIHDTLLQSLLGVALQFDAISRMLAPSNAAHARLAHVRHLIERNIAEARHAILNLRSPHLKKLDLPAEVEAAAARANSAAALRLRFSISGRPRACSPDVHQQLVRIVEEAVMNAVRHACGTEVHVHLAYERGAVVLEISDDGNGFDSVVWSAPSTDHFGLVGMRERCQDVGGTFELNTHPGEGTHIRAVVPLTSGSS